MAKRFYENVTVKAGDDGFVVMLDGRVLKTPGKANLTFKTETHAELVAAEWRAQSGEILPNTMPCTRLMNVAFEQTPSRRDELVKEFCAYAQTDLLCYRAQNPDDLAQRQNENWQPILDWAAQAHGIALTTTIGIKAAAQSQQSLLGAQKFAENLNNIDLTLLLHLTASYGSSLLALATINGPLTVDTAFALSRLDETYQNEHWGVDMEVVKKNRAMLQELTELAQLIEA